MVNTPILDITQVATNQNNKETTINTALAVIEGAISDTLALTMTSDRVLTKAQFTRDFHLRLTGAAVPRLLTIPATPRFFAISNEGVAAITVASATPGDTVVVEPGIRALLVSDGTDVYAVTSGMGTSGGFGAFVGMDDAAAGQVLKYDGAAWGPADLNSEHVIFVDGALDANKTLYRKVCVANERLFSDFFGSLGRAGAAGVGATILTVAKNGVTIGTITFPAGNPVPTFSTDVGAGSTTVLLAPGDVVTVTAPATPDAALTDTAVTLQGVYL